MLEARPLLFDVFGGHSLADTATPAELDRVCSDFTDLALPLEAAA